MNEDFLELLSSLLAAKARFLVIGAYAAAAAKQGLDTVREFGASHDLGLLIQEAAPGGLAQGKECMAIAGRILNADGCFIDNIGEGSFVFLLLFACPIRPPSPLPPPNVRRSPSECYAPGVTCHERAIARSCALHAAIAERLERDPSLVVRAQQRVESWLRDGSVARPYAEAWQKQLDAPLTELVVALVERSERMNDMRQVTPFAGVLDARTRWRVRRSAGT